MLALPADQRRGYTHNALIKREITEDYVRAVSNDPEKALSHEGVDVRPLGLDSYPNTHRYFNQETYDDFFSSIQWVPLVPAREHDATSAALVMRLREGRHSSDLFKSRYVMVTRNSTFVRHARRYCLESRFINQMQEGPIIYQRELATTAWLRTGLNADESIPRGHLIASCDRVLQVRPEVRAALANQLSQITPERLSQLNLLMQDARSVQKLTDQTLNNEKVITAENAEVLLEAMREATAEEVASRLEKEKQAAVDAVKQDHRTTAAELKRVTDLLNETDQQLKEAALLKCSQMRVLVSNFNQTAKVTEITLTSILAAIACLGGINYFTGLVQGSYVWAAVGFVAATLSVLRLIFAVLERPMPGLVTLMTHWATRYLANEGRRRGLPRELLAGSVRVERGRLIFIEPEM
jgi:hypothetical protein